MTERDKIIAARAAELLTIKEFAALSRLHPEYVREQCRQGRIIGAFKLCGSWRIDVAVNVPTSPCNS